MRVVVYLFGCVGMDLVALAPGDVELSLLPPPSKKSSEKCYGGLVSPDLLGKSVGKFLGDTRGLCKRICIELSWGFVLAFALP